MKALQCLLERLRDSFAALARETADEYHRAYRCGLSDGFNIALGMARYHELDANR